MDPQIFAINKDEAILSIFSVRDPNNLLTNNREYF